MYCCHDNKISQQNPNVVNFKIVNVGDLSIQTKADRRQPPCEVTGLLPLIFSLLTCTQTLFGGLCERRLDMSQRDMQGVMGKDERKKCCYFSLCLPITP